MKRLAAIAVLFCAAGSAAGAETFETWRNNYGLPGLLDMPNALSFPDADLSVTDAYFGGTNRLTGSFQILPRVTGSFRYTRIENFRGGTTGRDTNYDRSFSLHLKLLEEREYRPALAVGVNDLIGTGLYASEYLVATKHLTPRVRVSGGLGWGRLASNNGFTNPLGVLNENFETRPARTTGVGGEAEFDQFFRGDAAFFGGIEVRATDKLGFAVEYSSDVYSFEDGPTFDYRSPWNFGLRYALRDGVNLTASYMYGSEVGVNLTFALNPKNPPYYGGGDAAPYPVTPRGEVDAEALGWTLDDGGATATDQLAEVLEAEGIFLHGLSIQGGTARVEIENNRWRANAQAIGRTARILTASMPASVDTFVIVPMVTGLAGSQVTIRRADMEELAFSLDNFWESYARAGIAPVTQGPAPRPGTYPRFEYDISPYLQPSLFDPDAPVRLDAGVQLKATAEPAPGVVLRGAVRQKVFGNLDESTRVSNSVLPRVRSETNIYERTGPLDLTDLTATYFFKPGRDLYGRVTVGYLERHFGGVSSELLWKPVDSSLGLGLEANYVKQRAFDQGFEFRDYETATGFASVYYEWDNGFEAQLDAGRYLAGDWGATLTLQRGFANGWKVGAYATLTDVPFEEFGEGSFDKGILITIPIDWARGDPTRQTFGYNLKPILRDGGARLTIRDRLYQRVNQNQRDALRNGWGRFWK
ncbi:YjbH domain-containing protein [Roseivivax sp. GX 12232]|uniref:YjbH domain-containing protein n=1 Tax=Roseivivax sp. GX 12232 TaxID=2900547 RepID=UPI001E5B99E6|nr:YjbH domain-containing protein [Roseivivax sp. GX 12232]